MKNFTVHRNNVQINDFNSLRLFRLNKKALQTEGVTAVELFMKSLELFEHLFAPLVVIGIGFLLVKSFIGINHHKLSVV